MIRGKWIALAVVGLVVVLMPWMVILGVGLAVVTGIHYLVFAKAMQAKRWWLLIAPAWAIYAISLIYMLVYPVLDRIF